MYIVQKRGPQDLHVRHARDSTEQRNIKDVHTTRAHILDTIIDRDLWSVLYLKRMQGYLQEGRENKEREYISCSQIESYNRDIISAQDYCEMYISLNSQ